MTAAAFAYRITFKLENRHLIRAREGASTGLLQSDGYRWTHGLLRDLIKKAAPAAQDAGYLAHVLLSALYVDIIEELLDSGRSPEMIRSAQTALARSVLDGNRDRPAQQRFEE